MNHPEQEIVAPGEAIPPRGEEDLRLQQIELIARLMDSGFTIPNTRITFGFDAVIGLIPVLGDTISVFISSYIVKVAHELGVPHHVKARMTFNIFVDWLIGLVPVIGDAFDVGWKANRKNVELIKKHLARKKG